MSDKRVQELKKSKQEDMDIDSGSKKDEKTAAAPPPAVVAPVKLSHKYHAPSSRMSLLAMYKCVSTVFERKASEIYHAPSAPVALLHEYNKNGDRQKKNAVSASAGISRDHINSGPIH